MKKKIIKNAQVVNEGTIKTCDVLIVGERIEKIASQIADNQAEIIDAEGQYLLPGLIDDQVHFRDPGLTHKATIYSESRAAVGGRNHVFHGYAQHHTEHPNPTIVRRKICFSIQKFSCQLFFFYGHKSRQFRGGFKN
jgi:dihydroorotase